MFIIPVYLIDFDSYRAVALRSKKFLRIFTYVYFFSFASFLLAYMGDLKFILSYGDFGELKQLVYEGDAYGLTTYPAPIELILYPVRVLINSSVIMIFVFFFNITFLKEKWWINVMAFVSSTTVIVDGILNIDRSATFFWVLLIGLAVSMFWNSMSAKIKSVAVGFSTVLIVAAATYALSVTKDRFEERDSGTQGGIVLYLGQPYYHFCELWDYYPAPDGVTTKSLFPSIHKFIFKDFEGGVAYQKEMGLKCNMDLGVFYTHLGSFMLSAGNVGPFMITIAYLLVFYYVFRDSEIIQVVDGKKIRCFPFEKLMVLFFLLCIPVIGAISYYYANFNIETITYLTIAALFYFREDTIEVLKKGK
ncbi:MAG: hypothetical protein KBT22_07060 [Bacteroidales bacterium]|nr:hypothetical protein [Candidatus Scybalocola fimicaballi]